jgi:hypothetical protein
MKEPVSVPLFTTKFSQGRRTFFFDVKKTKTDKPFLRITASSLKGENKERSYLTVFDNEVQEFTQAITEAAGFILSS